MVGENDSVIKNCSQSSTVMHCQHRRVSHSPDQRTVYVDGVNALEELGEVPSAARH